MVVPAYPKDKAHVGWAEHSEAQHYQSGELCERPVSVRPFGLRCTQPNLRLVLRIFDWLGCGRQQFDAIAAHAVLDAEVRACQDQFRFA